MPGRCDSVFVIILDTMYFVVSQKNLEIRKSKKRENIVYNNYNSIIDYIYLDIIAEASLSVSYIRSLLAPVHTPIRSKQKINTSRL